MFASTELRKAERPADQPDQIGRPTRRLTSLALAAILVVGVIATPFWLGFIAWIFYEFAGWLAG